MSDPLLKASFRGVMDVKFPARILAEGLIDVTREGNVFTFDANYARLDTSPIIDPTASVVAVYDKVAGIFKQVSLSSVIQSSTVEQYVTGAGPIAILPETTIVRVNRTVDAPIVLNLPDSALKKGPVLITDWKGNAGSYSITINTTASADRFNGNLTSLVIAGDSGSVYLRPIAGVGYVQ